MEHKFDYTLWTELIAFEKNDPDRGAARYLNAMPMKPDAIFLFICTADFPFSYKGMAEEYELAPTVCSRDAHPRNEQRERQKWTNWQLRELIANLKKLGVPTYLSMFTGYYRGEFGPEWLSDHEELTYRVGLRGRLNPVGMLNDGTLCEKILAPKLAALCRDYGFAGFHGADRFNSAGLIYWKSVNDNMTKMFLQRTGLQAPSYVTEECDGNLEKQKKRQKWIWGEHRQEITGFFKTRWNEFWKEVASQTHAVGGLCIMNSSYTRGSHAAAGVLGIDYKGVVEAGVDAIVCETVALGLANQAPDYILKQFPEPHRHFHTWCLTAMMEIRAYLPDTRILFLHGCKDVMENWDNIRQSPAGYERELFSLASLCHYRKGKLYPAANGLTACLADGFSKSDWEFITSRWKSAIRSDELVRAGEFVFVWDDRMVSDGVEDYFSDHFPSAFDTIYKFKYQGLSIQSTARADELEDVHEPLIVPAAHLLGRETIEKLIGRPEPVVLIGRSGFLAEWEPLGAAFQDGRCTVLILNSSLEPSKKSYAPQPPPPPVSEDGPHFYDSFRVILPQMSIDPQLWQDAFAAVRAALDSWQQSADRLTVETTNLTDEWLTGDFWLQTREFADGRFEAIVESQDVRTLPVTLRYSHAVRFLRITSSFPFYPKYITDKTMMMFTMANRGMCALEVSRNDKGAE